jgi:murein DD-endopeptidase MepM/ murein hydrolase activator NlpD
MSKSGKNRSEKKTGWLLWLLPLAVAVPLAWLGFRSLDRDDPWVTLPEEFAVLGPKSEVTVKAGDAKSGLREVLVKVSQDGQDKLVVSRTFPPEGQPGQEVEIPLTLVAKDLGLNEGPATFTVAARDRSWRNGFKGRTRLLTKDLVVDLVPVNLAFLNVNHLLYYGGTGLILYHLNKETAASGVVVEGRLYRGFPVPGGNKGDHLVLFPIPREPAAPYQVELTARPKYGQEVKNRISLNLKPRKWRQDEMSLSENFLRQVSAAFSAQGDLTEAFLSVNREMRQTNHDKVREICRESRPEQLWEGVFERFKGKPMARFGDKRTYVYQGNEIDQQVHQGEDLASLERSLIPAANHGVVVFADSLGIYGQTVILDHGLGVFSMYSHLSQIDVQVGNRIEKGGPLGRTGFTGMAGGDHLHFSVIIQGEFVDPREWWDPQWHRDQLQGPLSRMRASEESPA